MRTLLTLFVLLVVVALGRSEDWPQFRGPTGDGHYAGKLPTAWSESENVAWKTAIHDKGWSSPIVLGKKVWLTTAKEDGKELYVVALDRESGKIVHDISLFAPVEPPSIKQFNSHASPTPTAADGRIYAHFGSYGTACLNADTAEIVWKVTDLPCNHFRGPASSPVVHGNAVFLQFDGFDKQYVVALDKLTGKPIWRKDRNLPYPDDGDFKKAFATPAVLTIDGRSQLVSPAAMGTISYDLATGEELWRVVHGGMNEAAKPLFSNGLIYLTTGHTQSVWAVKPGTGDLSATNIAWKSLKEAPTKSSLLTHGEWLFMVNDKGIVSCLAAKTGKVLKQERLPMPFAASPLLADGKLYFVSEGATCKTYVLKADESLEMLATNTLADGAYASPAAANGKLFLRTKTHLYCIGK